MIKNRISSTVLILVLSLCFGLLSSCAALKSVSQTTIPAKKGKKVSVEVKKHIFFFLAFSTSYVENLHLELRAKCPKGKIQGILTKNYKVTYFPIIYHQDIVSAEGYCNEI